MKESSVLCHYLHVHPKIMTVSMVICGRSRQCCPSIAMYIIAGCNSNFIPETPIATSKSISKTSSVAPTPLKDHNACRLDGSAIDPITLSDSDDNEAKTTPLFKRSVTDSVTSLTPSQAAVAAALGRLSTPESSKKPTEANPSSRLFSDARNDSGRVKQVDVEHSSKVSKEQCKHAPSTSVSRPGGSSRTEVSRQSTTADQTVDLSSPQFVLRPGN